MFMVKSGTSHIVPFERDRLYISIYDACRHRPTAIKDATALVETIIGLFASGIAAGGIVTRSDLVKTTADVLRRFDSAANVYYMAFHKL